MHSGWDPLGRVCENKHRQARSSEPAGAGSRGPRGDQVAQLTAPRPGTPGGPAGPVPAALGRGASPFCRLTPSHHCLGASLYFYTEEMPLFLQPLPHACAPHLQFEMAPTSLGQGWGVQARCQTGLGPRGYFGAPAGTGRTPGCYSRHLPPAAVVVAACGPDAWPWPCCLHSGRAGPDQLQTPQCCLVAVPSLDAPAWWCPCGAGVASARKAWRLPVPMHRAEVGSSPSGPHLWPRRGVKCPQSCCFSSATRGGVTPPELPKES